MGYINNKNNNYYYIYVTEWFRKPQPIFGRVKVCLIGSQRNIYTDTDPTMGQVIYRPILVAQPTSWVTCGLNLLVLGAVQNLI